MDGPSVISVDAVEADGGSSPHANTGAGGGAGAGGSATPLAAGGGDAGDDVADLAFASMDAGDDSPAARIARLHRDFLLQRYQLLAGDAGGVDGRTARALLAYALGRDPTDEEFAPYGAVVEAADLKVAFDAWFSVYRTTAQLDKRLAAALPPLDGSTLLAELGGNVQAPKRPTLTLPSAPGGPRPDRRRAMAVRQSWVHRYASGISGWLSRWKRKYLELNYTQENMSLYSNDKRSNTPTTYLLRDILTCAADPSNRRGSVFAVTMRDEPQPTLFAVDSDEERDAWVKAILTHCLVHAVVSNMGLDRVKALVQQGAAVNATKNDKAQYPPVLLALCSDQTDVAKFLLKEARADGSCLFRWQAYKHDRVPPPADLVAMLRECGRDDVLATPSDDEFEWTALHYLALDGKVDTIRELIDAGVVSAANASQANAHGDMPVIMSLKAAGPSAVQLAMTLLPVSDLLRGCVRCAVVPRTRNPSRLPQRRAMPPGALM